MTTGPRRYVDLRVYLPEKPEYGLPNADDVPALDRLEWGFAGQSKATSAEWDGPRLVMPAHGTWTHWVDSQKPDGYEDDGFMYDQHDGLTWEKGIMEHPKTGKLTPYEEVWEDFAPAKDAAGNMITVTLVHTESGNSAKGMVIRVGDWIQGILRDAGGGVTVERWHYAVSYPLESLFDYLTCRRHRKTQKDGNEWSALGMGNYLVGDSLILIT